MNYTWDVSKHIDLPDEGVFKCYRVVCEDHEHKVIQATYYGYLDDVEHLTPEKFVIEAKFLEPVNVDVDAILNATWEKWALEDVYLEGNEFDLS